MRRPIQGLLLATISVLCLVAAGRDQTTTFVFERLNGTYTDLGADVEEIDNGMFTVVPSSSSNQLTLKGHSLKLTPLGDGEHRAKVWIHFEGEADVAAEIRLAGISSGQLEDQVIIPDQERRVSARIKLARREGGYLITLLKSQPDLEIAIQSQLAQQVVSFCESVTRFTPGTDCEAIQAALSHPKVPMPEPGSVFELDSDQMTQEERTLIEAYLAKTES